MKVKLSKSGCTLTLLPGEKVRSESALFYAMRNALLAQGRDVIKKCPGKDGHLFSAPWYVRDRRGRYCIFDGDYAIRDCAQDLNAARTLTLNVMGVIQ